MAIGTGGTDALAAALFSRGGIGRLAGVRAEIARDLARPDIHRKRLAVVGEFERLEWKVLGIEVASAHRRAECLGEARVIEKR